MKNTKTASISNKSERKKHEKSVIITY